MVLVSVMDLRRLSEGNCDCAIARRRRHREKGQDKTEPSRHCRTTPLQEFASTTLSGLPDPSNSCRWHVMSSGDPGETVLSAIMESVHSRRISPLRTRQSKSSDDGTHAANPLQLTDAAACGEQARRFPHRLPPPITGVRPATGAIDVPDDRHHSAPREKRRLKIPSRSLARRARRQRDQRAVDLPGADASW